MVDITILIWRTNSIKKFRPLHDSFPLVGSYSFRELKKIWLECSQKYNLQTPKGLRVILLKLKWPEKLVEMFVRHYYTHTHWLKIKDRGVFSRFCAPPPLEGKFLVLRPWGGPHHIIKLNFVELIKVCLSY